MSSDRNKKERFFLAKADTRHELRNNVLQMLHAGDSAGRKVSSAAGHPFVGLGVQLLSEKKFNRNYVLVEIGRLSTDPSEYIDITNRRSTGTGRMYFGVIRHRFIRPGRKQCRYAIKLSVMPPVKPAGLKRK